MASVAKSRKTPTLRVLIFVTSLIDNELADSINEITFIVCETRKTRYAIIYGP